MMYTPPVYAAEDADVIEAMLERAGLAVLVTHGPEGLFATHAPFQRLEGVFRGHFARRNPHMKLAGAGEALLIFPGPDAYVSPAAYASKALHGRVVPTWMYEAVHVYGTLSWFEGPDLLAHVEALSDRHEAGRPAPWSVHDAPPDYIEGLSKGIVGVELRPTRIEAARKLSQTLKTPDRLSAIDTLGREAPDVARLLRELES